MDSRSPSDASGSSVARRLPGVVLRLGWISFCLDLASEMIHPVLPLFLGATLAAPGLALGWIEGVAQAVASGVGAWSGARSDRLRRRVPFIRLGYGLAGLAKPLLALAGSWHGILVLRALDRLGKGLRGAPRDALIADVAGPRRGAAFGFHRAMDTSGALVGVGLAALLLAWMPGAYRTVFALTAVPAALAIALTFTVRESSKAAGATTPDPRAPQAGPALSREYWMTAALLWWFALGQSSQAFLLLRASETGLGDGEVLGAYAAFNLVYAASAYPAGKLSDRLGRVRVLALGWCLFAAGHAVFAGLEGRALWLGFVLEGVCMGLTHGVATAWVVDRAPEGGRGKALGVYQLGVGVALLTSSVAAGLLWDRISPRAPFWMGVATALVALALMPLVARQRR